MVRIEGMGKDPVISRQDGSRQGLLGSNGVAPLLLFGLIH
jgi:hypothetical protein